MYPSSLPNIDLQVLPTFQANVVATGGVDISKSGLTYTFGLNFQNVVEETNVFDLSKREVLAQDTDTGAFWRIKLSNLQTVLSPHTHPVAEISDATVIGRNLVTAVDAAAARAAIGAGVLSGYRNKIINGDFEVHQRGVAATTSNQYAADRWKLVCNVGASVTLGRQQLSDTAADQIPTRPRYCMRLDVASTGGEDVYFEQGIEGVGTLQGKRATLTFGARGSGLSAVYASVYQHFGSGGSPSAPVFVASIQAEFSGDFVKNTLVFDMPSIAGKTLGTNNDDRVLVRFSVPAASGAGVFDVAHVSLVEGDASEEDDPFEPRHIAQELALCHRYYWQGPAIGGDSGYRYASANSTLLAGPDVVLPVPMRVPPSVSIVTAPVYIGCSHNDINVSGVSGFQHRLNKDNTTGLYRAASGVYAANADY